MWLTHSVLIVMLALRIELIGVGIALRIKRLLKLRLVLLLLVWCHILIVCVKLLHSFVHRILSRHLIVHRHGELLWLRVCLRFVRLEGLTGKVELRTLPSFVHGLLILYILSRLELLLLRVKVLRRGSSIKCLRSLEALVLVVDRYRSIRSWSEGDRVDVQGDC